MANKINMLTNKFFTGLFDFIREGVSEENKQGYKPVLSRKKNYNDPDVIHAIESQDKSFWVFNQVLDSIKVHGKYHYDGKNIAFDIALTKVTPFTCMGRVVVINDCSGLGEQIADITWAGDIESCLFKIKDILSKNM